MSTEKKALPSSYRENDRETREPMAEICVCEFCARDFKPKPNDPDIARRFCSAVCYESAFTHGETD